MTRSERRWGDTAALVLLAAAVLFFRLGLPFELDALTQDVFHAQRPLWDILRR